MNTKNVKKRNKSKEESSNMYFGPIQEEAFSKYIKSDNKKEKDRIFSSILYPAFTKMIESIIRRYEIYTPNEDIEDTLQDTMTHLLCKLENFDPDKNKKLYSYCGTICKNYLILKRVTTIKHLDRNLPYGSLFNDGDDDTREDDYDEDEHITLDIFNDKVIHELNLRIIDMLSNPEMYHLKENDIIVGSALLSFLDSWEEHIIDEKNKYNKLIFLTHMRDNTLLETNHIRKSLKKFKDIYMEVKHNELNREID